MKIYTVWVVCLEEDGTDYKYGTSANGNKFKLGDRVWGWFSSFEAAEDIVLNNRTDIFEFMYNFACIEEVEEGILNHNEVKQWYRATFDAAKIDTGPYPEVTKCEVPKLFKRICNLTMG